MTTMFAFCEKHGITAEVAAASSNPNLEDDGWAAIHYSVTLRREDEATIEVPFSTGAAASTPTREVVLDCLASDASFAAESLGDFERFAEELGYDTDSRKAEQQFRTVLAQTDRLRDFLGDELLTQLLEQVDRL